METYSTFLADGIWWDVTVTGYIRVGGALDGLLCGCSSLLLYRDVGHSFWGTGASISYIPDWFRKWIDLLTYPYCKGANTHDIATGPHAIQMDIGTHFAAWTVGKII